MVQTLEELLAVCNTVGTTEHFHLVEVLEQAGVGIFIRQQLLQQIHRQTELQQPTLHFLLQQAAHKYLLLHLFIE